MIDPIASLAYRYHIPFSVMERMFPIFMRTSEERWLQIVRRMGFGNV